MQRQFCLRMTAQPSSPIINYQNFMKMMAVDLEKLNKWFEDNQLVINAVLFHNKKEVAINWKLTKNI